MYNSVAVGLATGIAATGITIAFALSQLFSFYYIPSRSMETTLLVGDILLVEKVRTRHVHVITDVSKHRQPALTFSLPLSFSHCSRPRPAQLAMAVPILTPSSRSRPVLVPTHRHTLSLRLPLSARALPPTRRSRASSEWRPTKATSSCSLLHPASRTSCGPAANLPTIGTCSSSVWSAGAATM